LAVNKKKVHEALEALNEKKLIFLLGESGSGKNALISTYCKEQNIFLDRFSHTDKLSYDERNIKNPQDLEALIGFLRKSSNSRETSNNQYNSQFQQVYAGKNNGL
jgi:ABC-type phosphate transport system ATPase subunit